MTSTRLTRFLGDGEREFNLAGHHLVKLEKQLGRGIGEISQDVCSGRFHHRDLIEVVRFGLLGGGTSPEEAKRLIDVFVDGSPIKAAHALALEILDAAWDGTPEPKPDTNIEG